MQKVQYKDIQTSSLGFGCAKLTSNFSEKAALSNLHTAYDNGITHFDTARLYGFGQAERIVGKFVKGKRHRVTITSKFGISPAKSFFNNLFVLNSARALVNTIRPLKKILVAKTNGLAQAGNFSPSEAEISLNITLKELGTDYVDFLLMHEATVDNANNERIIEFLEKKKAQGKLRYYGIGSHHSYFNQNIHSLNPLHSVVQFDCVIPEETCNYQLSQEKLLINYNIFKNLGFLKKVFASLGFRQNLTTMLPDAYIQNPVHFILNFHKSFSDRITLFTSANNKNIKQTISLWNSPPSFVSADLYSEIFDLINKHLKDEL